MVDDKLIRPNLVDPIEDRESRETDRELQRSDSDASDKRGPEGAPVRKPLFGR